MRARVYAVIGVFAAILALDAGRSVATSQSCTPVTISCSQLHANCKTLCGGTSNPGSCIATACAQGLQQCRVDGRFANQYGCRQTANRK